MIKASRVDNCCQVSGIPVAAAGGRPGWAWGCRSLSEYHSQFHCDWEASEQTGLPDSARLRRKERQPGHRTRPPERRTRGVHHTLAAAGAVHHTAAVAVVEEIHTVAVAAADYHRRTVAWAVHHTEEAAALLDQELPARPSNFVERVVRHRLEYPPEEAVLQGTVAAEAGHRTNFHHKAIVAQRSHSDTALPKRHTDRTQVVPEGLEPVHNCRLLHRNQVNPQWWEGEGR
jgi:hypothetical protein